MNVRGREKPTHHLSKQKKAGESPVPIGKKKPPMLRIPRLEDAPGIWNLVCSCKPLDLNSRYAYLLLCHHFADTCVVAEGDSRLLGFLSAYRPPPTPDVIFVWQVAVHADARGQGLGKRMLEELLRRSACEGVSGLETTVTPSNTASLALFRSLAKRLDTTISKAGLFPEEVFGADAHEEEILYRVGPFNREKLFEQEGDK